MFKRAKSIGFLAAAIFIFFLFNITFYLKTAEATSQWARKYKTGCTTCHTVFPRLNYYGDRFLRNGYQDPDDAKADGDRMKKRINPNLVMDRVSNLFGFRINLTPISVKEEALTLGGNKKTQVTLGDANWIQFFVAGSIFKNVSFFSEMQFNDDDFHFSWWHLGLHNLFDTSSVNFFIGNVSPLDFGSHSNRLRMFAPIKNVVYNIKTANGTGDDSLGISGSRPAIQYFGYKGPVVWWAGISPGSSAKNKTDKYFYWGGIRAEVTEAMESDFEGSNITFWVFQGEDGKNIAPTSATPADYYTSTSQRFQVAGNMRYKDFDLQTAYVWGDDDDGNLATKVRDKFDFYGVALQASYFIDTKWYPAVSYDYVSEDSGSGGVTTAHTITPAISYLLRENMRFGFYATFDINNETGHTKQNTYMINIRTMF